MAKGRKEKEKDPVGLFYMIKTIYPMCFSAKPSYYLFIQSVNLFNGLANGADLLVTQIFFDSVYDASVGTGTARGAVIALAAYVALKLAANLLEGARQYTVEAHHQRVTGFMNSKIHQKAARIDPVAYEDPRQLDDIDKAAQGVDSAIYFNAVTSFLYTYHLPYFIFMMIYLHSLKPMLTLCLLFVFVPVLVSHVLRSTVFSGLEDTVAPVRRKYDAYFDAACGKDFYKETRILGAFGYFKGLLNDSIDLLNGAVYGARKRTALIDMCFHTLSFMGYGGIVLLSVRYLLAGEISVGAFSAVFTSIGMLFSAMEYFIGTHIGSIADDFGKIRNFLRFLAIPESGRERCEIDKKGAISLEKVSFRYPNAETDSLRNITLTINPGETVAIVGENGAGKTTLVKLLTGLYEPTEGTVGIGNTDISKAAYRSIFENMSGVFQKYQRYALTLRENVQIADFGSGRGDGMIEKLLEENHIDSGNRHVFPEGLDTMLSREFDGTDLSGGQWQRIAIARGFYRDSDIIVLDEPTAAIDPLEESAIYRKFVEIAEDKTAVIVTHRLGSAKIAERIIVMQGGEIVETGSHDELMGQDGVYAAMFRAQAKWYNLCETDVLCQ